MLNFSDAADARMAMKNGCRPAARVEMTIGVTTYDITHRLALGGLGTLFQRYRTVSRQTERGQMTLRFKNGDGYFTPGNASSPFTGAVYAGATFTVSLGVYLFEHTVEVLPRFVGVLSKLDVDAHAEEAEIVLTDLFHTLLDREVGGFAGRRFDDEAPSAICLDLLGANYAAVPSTLIDSASFASKSFEERSERCICRGFVLEAGTWLRNIETLLDHAQAGLRVNGAGKFQYFTQRPSIGGAGGGFVVTEDYRLGRLARYTEEFRPVRNQVVVERNGATPPESTRVTTINSPLSDGASITNYGTRAATTKTLDLFTEDFPAEQAAGESLFWVSGPPKTYEIAVGWEGIVVELGDIVRLTSARLAIDNLPLQVFGVRMDPGRALVTLSMIDAGLDNQPWLYLENSQTLDSTPRAKVW